MKILNLFSSVLFVFSSPVCFSLKAVSQIVPDTLFEEKVYLHTDRENYFPGEDLWFKAYLIDASERVLTDYSNNLHVELINPMLQIIDSRVIRLEDGLGNGDFHLSEKLTSGRYNLRAYTNYMRNYGDQLFFNKYITIINPTDVKKIFSDSIAVKKGKAEISFFPEGGSLVDNVPSVVGFKAVNEFGRGCDVEGEIYASTGEIVSLFKSVHRGMGTFSITPVSGKSYYALVKNDGESFRFDIPPGLPKGAVINVSGNIKDELKVTVRTNAETLPSLIDHDLSLVVSYHNVFIKKADFRIKSLADRFSLSVEDIPDGIVMLTLIDSDARPLCERLVFIQKEEDASIDVSTDKAVHIQRDSVSVRLSVKTCSQIPLDAFLSFSATRDVTDNHSEYPSTICSWFLLESDVRGAVEAPSYYFDASNPNRLKDLDLLLLTQGWRDFKWKYSGFFPPERGFSITGRARKKLANVTLKNTEINIALLKNGNSLLTNIHTDSAGRFSLTGVDMKGSGTLVASLVGDKETSNGWIILDSLKYHPEKVNDSGILNNSDDGEKRSKTQADYKEIFVNEDLKLFVQYAEIKSSFQRKYKLTDTITPGTVTIVAKRQDNPESARARSRYYLHATPDIELVLDSRMQVYQDAYQLIKRKFFAPVPMISSPRIQNPIFLIDGAKVPVENIIGFPISFIERIDVLKETGAVSIFSAMGGMDPTKLPDGVISIITRQGAPLSSGLRSFNSVNTKFSGYNESRIFYSPKHTTSLLNDFKPDLRTTLFWEPNLITKTNKDLFIKFFNGDNPSLVRIIVEGITSNGIPVAAKAEYEVK